MGGILGLLLGFALDRLGYMGPVRAYLQTAIVPIQRMITSTGQEVSRSFEQTQSIQALQAENEALVNERNRLEVENVRLKEIERENELLRQLLNYTRSNPQFNYQPTLVKGRSIGFDPTNLLYYVYVDVGIRRF